MEKAFLFAAHKIIRCHVVQYQETFNTVKVVKKQRLESEQKELLRKWRRVPMRSTQKVCHVAQDQEADNLSKAINYEALSGVDVKGTYLISYFET